MSDEIKKFCLVGIVTCPQFQKCRCFLKSLHRSFPKAYQNPDIRPMLNVEWNEYLTKMRREIGGKMWSLKSDLVVLLDGEILGGDVELLNYLSTKFRLSIKRDFQKMGKIHLKEILQKTLDSGRNLVYMTVAADLKVIGTILILLYSDLVPKTVDYFLKCCRNWPSAPINRIVEKCWIQCTMSRKPHKLPCENYVVTHDRRGVLSTCNSSKHTDNSCQFSISLNPTPWMDYKYVAFGQVIQGDEVLTFIENISTCYEKPNKDIEITACGEFVLDEDVDEKTIKELERFLEIKDHEGKTMNVEDTRDVASELSVTKYMQGLYALPTDMVSLTAKYLKQIEEECRICWMDEVEEGSNFLEQVIDHTHDRENLDRGKILLSRKDLRFGSDIYSKAHKEDFKIEDISLRKQPSDVQETLSHTTVTPVTLQLYPEQKEPITNQYNSLYLN